MPQSIHAPSDEPADADLLRRVQAGQVEAFAPLLRRHLSSIRAFVALKLPVPHLADEVSHETFVVAYRRIAEFDTTQPFRPWLRAIAWNLVRKELLRFAREQANLSRFKQAQIAELTEAVERGPQRDEAIYLEECVADLPENMRRLIEERYRRGLSPDELAEMFGRTSEWVRVTLFRLRKQLRECIEFKLERNTHAI
jgi:RNA polymerase sigma-70 factor (ECF subfamily)